MNFRGDYFIFLILSIILTITSIEANQQQFEVCPNLQTNLEQVQATIYFNGCTNFDGIMFSNVCYWRSGFPKDVLSLTLKVGGEVVCENGEYTCISDNVEYDCTCTFKYACLSQLMDQETLLNLICCTEEADKSLEVCITEFGMDEKVTKCMNGETNINPQKIALDNANEIFNKGIDLNEASEPFNLFGQTYDQCVDWEAYYWWPQSICSMLTEAKFNQLDNCKQAFSN